MSFTENELAQYYKMAHPKSIKSVYFMHKDNLQNLIDAKNNYGADFLYFIIKNDNTPLYNSLIHKGVNFNYDTITQSGETLLHVVKDIRMLEILLTTSAKKYIFYEDKKNNTILHRYINKTSLVEAIKPYFKDYQEKEDNPILKNINIQSSGDVNKFLKIYDLFDRKLNITFEDKNQTPFLFSLMYHASAEQIKKIIDTSIDLSILSSQGNNLAHYLIETGLYERLDLFKSYSKIDLNHQNKEGRSPLMTALSIGNGNAINYLIKGGLNPMLEEINQWLKTPIITAIEAFGFWLSKEGSIKKIKEYNLLKEAKSYTGRLAKDPTFHAILEKMILEESLLSDTCAPTPKKLKI